ncbi:pyridoxal phosphate-dependent aminotransferase [Porticoccus sp. W117]|uniref:pyridoxal phosphate-dependent aminotransferase n=1 Tax=Porticoccus sp. W117 TaxID=3054777 RepID=UPI002597EFCB|nr:pyridoxal phosphate-dependent aminotransferase [Porticoccus sp. W117]MDM3871912.1 pyridoxal phosphate-dependent aminotransferase [Porticoccus sp. W117]
MKAITKSNKLDNVCYDIRGPILDHANRLEEEGNRILKLNIGNPATFDLLAPEEILQDVIVNLPDAQGYGHAKGLYSARKAVMQRCQLTGIDNVTVDDIVIGNGVSEMIVMAMQALLNDGDEILVPAPDYPLWTAAITLAGGKAVHYLCDEENGWQPDIDDIHSKSSDRTRGIVVINPNNPTGAVYSETVLRELVEVAKQQELIVFADEIYDQIIYDDAVHIPLGSLVTETPCITFNGLSKTHRLAGFRAGWLILSGAKHLAQDYFRGIEMLASMRLCANMPAQHGIQTALGGYQSIEDLVVPGGRLYEQKELAWRKLNDIPGISCVKPMGALYLFPRIDPAVYNITNDEEFALNLLKQEHILLVHGTGFNWPKPDHFRIVFLPDVKDLEVAIDKLAAHLRQYRT